MRYTVVYYNDRVQTEIDQWPESHRTVYERTMQLLQQYGLHAVGMPYIRVMKEGLFEIRAKTGRAVFCIMIKDTIMVLHAFIKKTQKTPKKDLVLARKRLKEVRTR
jgi:phage-related protein